MKWSWRLGRVMGVELRLHATFLMLLAWLAIVDFRASGSIAGATMGVLFTLALFAAVLLHELGHAAAARRFGVPTRDITLLPIGGVARIERIPDNPRQELVIALAGPAVTLVIAAVLGLGLSLAGLPIVSLGDVVTHRSVGAFVGDLVWANIALLIFNLLPAFPMDGGRVLRALLALRLGFSRATDLAMRVGQGFALAFGLLGLLYNPLLVLIALFIWISAAAESAELVQRSALGGVTVGQMMIRDLKTLSPHDTLNEALRLILTGFQQDFPVLDGERVTGVLTRASFLDGLAKRGAGSLVGGSMISEFQTATPSERVIDVLPRLRDTRCRAVPVIAGGQLCGLLTLDNVAEYVMIETALNVTDASKPAAARAVAKSGAIPA